MALTPASLATSVSRILSGLVRFRPIRRSYHKQLLEQTDIDSATKGLLIEQLPKPYKMRTLSVRPDFGSARIGKKNKHNGGGIRRRPLRNYREEVDVVGADSRRAKIIWWL